MTEPRLPCFKLGIKIGRPDIIKRFLRSGRTGFYLAIVHEGEVGAGDEIERLDGGREQLTVADLVRLASNREFLTRKLWDAGNSAPYGHRGDLTTLTEAIHFHGGEARAVRDAFVALPPDDQAAVVEFLRMLRVLPDGSPRVVVERNRN